MVRSLNLTRSRRSPAAWKPFLALVIASGALLWHLLACTESPLAFSPDSRHLAFTAVQPYDADHLATAGQATYRLMILTDAKDLRILETATDYMISAPAFSPDGKTLAYLRLPLLSEKLKEQLKTFSQQRQDALRQLRSEPNLPAAHAPALSLASADLALPSLDSITQTVADLLAAAPLPLTLVLRDPASGNLRQEIALELPFLSASSDNAQIDLLFAYLLTRPQFNPDDPASVFFSLGPLVCSVNTQTPRLQLWGLTLAHNLATRPALLSPDGQTLAFLCGENADLLALASTRDRRYIWLPWPLPQKPSLSGLAWLNDRTLAAFLPPAAEPNEPARLALLTADGRLEKLLDLPLPIHKTDDADTGELALSPASRRLVVAFSGHAYFLTADGNLLADLTRENEIFAQPAFTPDGRLVAFKHFTQQPDHDDKISADAIVFFTPDGRELSRTPIPQEKGSGTFFSEKEEIKGK